MYFFIHRSCRVKSGNCSQDGRLRQILTKCRIEIICRMDLPHDEGAVSVSETARRLGVNRRTIQRWVKAGHVFQFPSGNVLFSQCVRQMEKRNVGRPTKGKLWDNPLYWRVKGTAAAKAAERFLGRLEPLQAMLMAAAFWHTQQGLGPDFQQALRQVLGLAERLEQKKKDDDVSWMSDAGKFIEKHDSVMPS